MSALVAENRIDEVKRLINKSFDLLFMISVPLIVFSIYFAPEIIYLISGNGYEGAITPMRMVMPLVLIIGMEQILIVQLLMPLKKDHSILINSIIGGLCWDGGQCAIGTYMGSKRFCYCLGFGRSGGIAVSILFFAEANR